jgi:hypothetical protein
MTDKQWTMFLHRIHGNRRIARFCAKSAKGVGFISLDVGFGADEFAVGSTTPVVGAAGMEKAAGQSAERSDELALIAALKSGSRKLQKKLLESLVRLRRGTGTRVSGVGSQCPPIAWLRD